MRNSYIQIGSCKHTYFELDTFHQNNKVNHLFGIRYSKFQINWLSIVWVFPNPSNFAQNNSKLFR